MGTIDSTQASAVEAPDLETLWSNLTEINSCINIVQDQRIGLFDLDHENLHHPSLQRYRNGQHSKLQAITSKLEGLRDSTRSTINQRLRPNLRPLNILDLPDELLRHIFRYIRGHTSMYELYFFDMHPGDVEHVKKLRLTCRRFCENSSHLLMFYILVDMTPQSLSRLNEISQHPTISKGIRAIQVSLGRHYDSGIAHDIRAFARYQASRLWTLIEDWEWILGRRGERPIWDQTPAEVYERAIERATPVAVSWDKVSISGVDENQCLENDLLRRAHQHFQQCYESQLLLERETFAPAISFAMTRMPTATWLQITSQEGFRAWREDLENLQFFEKRNFDDPNLLELEPKLCFPELSWSSAYTRGLRSPPISIISSILLSIEQAGITLTGLDIFVDPPSDLSSMSTSEVEYPKLRAVSKPLKAFTFRPRYETDLPLETLNILGGFLSAILDTSALQRIDLNFGFMYTVQNVVEEDIHPTISMASLILSRTWPSLKILRYNGPFYFKELQQVISRIDKKAKLTWCGYLMDTSWAEVLDFLRDRVSWNFELGDMSTSIAGAECNDMTRDEINFIFGEDDKINYERGSKATQFVRGSWTMQTNPMRDLENGDLVLPEFEEEDAMDVDDEPETDDDPAT